MYDIAKIKETANLVSVIRQAGIELRHNRACCPFHAEKTASFFVHPSGKYYKCFGCGAGGDVINFVQRFYKIDFKSAVRRLESEYGLGELSYAKAIKHNADNEITRKFNEWERNTANVLTELFREMYFYIRNNSPELALVDADDKYIYAVNHIDLIGYYLDEIIKDGKEFYKIYGEREVPDIARRWFGL